MTGERGSVYRNLYEKLIALYPKSFRERLGGSMMQTFDDLCRERLKISKRSKVTFGFVLRIYFNTGVGIAGEHLTQLTQRSAQKNVMNETMTNSRRAAIIGFFLSLPLAALFFLFSFGIEPPFAYLLDNPDPDKPDVAGSLIVLVSALLLPAAFIINLRPIRQGMRAGKGVMANPLNLILAAAIVMVFAGFTGSIIADQYPCWMGVPNCD